MALSLFDMKQKKVIILGAGISGLSYAYFLKKFHPKINFEIIEKSDRLGGMVYTEQVKEGLFEWGPRGIRPNGNGQVVLEMIEDLGIWDQLTFANEDAKKRYLFHDNALNVLPYSIKSFLFSPYLKILLKACYKDLRCTSFNGDESIADYADRHFGESFRRLFFDSMISGIWAGSVEKTSVSAAFPLLKKLELRNNSLIKSLLTYKKSLSDSKQYSSIIRSKALFSFKGGLEVLIVALKKFLKGNIRYGTHIDKIEFSDSISLFYDGKTHYADELISTIPAFNLSSFMTSPLKEKLESIPYSPVAVLNIGMLKSAINFDGFGFLVPSKENSVVLGMVANTNTFPEQAVPDFIINTVMMGGDRYTINELRSMDLEKVALDFLERVFDKKLYIESKSLILFEKAIPQYEVGHLDKVKVIESLSPPNLRILGNFMYGVSLIDIVCKSREIAKNQFS
tara:strand:+ start:14788 stop:16146 length:1359 start_codon:yes stop_codon:yes gene_type:complete